MRRMILGAVLAASALAPSAGHAANAAPVVTITTPAETTDNVAVVTATPDASLQPPAPGSGPRANYAFPITFRGSASDADNRVLAIELVIYAVGAPNSPSNPTEVSQSQGYPASCDSCPSNSVSWSRTHSLLPGWYVVEASAVDELGKIGTSKRTWLAVVPGPTA